ncbi:hypothetical protein ES288_A06G046300v1 [Gossypium darwinii]|uniref:Uncharacterized protein n=1 Tax=Gossypium darwinii TaxID=34276 RepID=A0A5D2G430_GOSDA|nr:hypothetical protein ES288_A06G046300v1 [Gossypium darwinii]
MDGSIIFVGGIGGTSNSFNLLLIVFFAVDMSVHSLLFDELEALYSSSSEDAGFNDFAISSSKRIKGTSAKIKGILIWGFWEIDLRISNWGKF